MTDNSTAALALSTAAIVPSIYSMSLPNLSTARAEADDRGHMLAAEQYAAIVSASVVLGLAAATRSPEVAVAGLIAVVGVSAAYRRAVRAQP